MTQQQISELKAEIIKANPRKFHVADCYCGDLHDNTIRLADVLLAMGSKMTLDYIIGDKYFEFIDYDDDEPNTVFMWDLTDDNLDNQSEETKMFLYKLLIGKE